MKMLITQNIKIIQRMLYYNIYYFKTSSYVASCFSQEILILSRYIEYFKVVHY